MEATIILEGTFVDANGMKWEETLNDDDASLKTQSPKARVGAFVIVWGENVRRRISEVFGERSHETQHVVTAGYGPFPIHQFVRHRIVEEGED